MTKSTSDVISLWLRVTLRDDVTKHEIFLSIQDWYEIYSHSIFATKYSTHLITFSRLFTTVTNALPGFKAVSKHDSNRKKMVMLLPDNSMNLNV